MSMLDNLRPKAKALVDALAAAQLPPFESLSPEGARGLAEKLRRPRPVRELAEAGDADAGGVPVRIYRDSHAPRATIIYYHAGGWVMGGLDESDGFARDLAAETGCRVVSVGYRLAPEHPFPAAHDDADTALAWAAETFADAPLVTMGESAGGNLATVAAMHARDRGRPVAAQILAYPVTDGGAPTATYRTYADGPLLTAPLMDWFWNLYQPDAAARGDTRLAPARGDLAGLPPALVITAEHDVLRDEGEAYAAALEDAGVRVTLRRFDGQIHTFLALGLAEDDEDAFGEITRFIAAAIA